MTKKSILPLIALTVVGMLGPTVVAATIVSTSRLWKIEQIDQPPVRAIHLFELTPEVIVTRLLLVSPSEDHLVLTAVADPNSGVDRFRLLLEEIDWWAEVELATDRAASDSEAFLKRSANEGWPAQIPAELRTKDGLVCAGLLPHAEGQNDTWTWMAASNQMGESCSSALTIPARLQPAVWFLEATLPRDFDPERPDRDLHGAAWGPIIDALAMALRQQGHKPTEGGSTQGWVVEELPVRNGSALSAAEDLEFVAGFRSVQNADPLADARAPRARPD